MSALWSTADLRQRVVDRYVDLAADSAFGSPDSLRSVIDQLIDEEAPVLAANTACDVAASVVNRVAGLGPLQPLFDDPSITDVLINGPGPVWVERDGRLIDSGVLVDPTELATVVERVLAPLGLRVDRACPIADGRLADGSRISVVGPPVSVAGFSVAIRRFAQRPHSLAAFASPPVVDVLVNLVRRRSNLLVFGGTGCGKTSLLTAMVAEVPDHERIITIEDTAELSLPGRQWVRLEARSATAEGVGVVTMGNLVRASLRLRPDRLVVGEVRGPEAADMLWALGTGHDGSFSTCHASSAPELLQRLQAFVLEARPGLPASVVEAQIAAGIDALIEVQRCPDGARRVVQIVEVPALVGEPLRPLVAGDVVVASSMRPARGPQW